MSYRTLGKKFDWDFEKYRLSRKPKDFSNKRRLSRNMARFFKNPFGYIYWKTFKLFKATRFPMICLAISVPLYLNYLTDLSEVNEKQMKWIHIQGAERPESFLQKGEDKNSKRAIPMTFIWNRIYSHLPTNFVVANPTYKQNYRLYFDRKEYQPSKISLLNN